MTQQLKNSTFFPNSPVKAMRRLYDSIKILNSFQRFSIFYKCNALNKKNVKVLKKRELILVRVKKHKVINTNFKFKYFPK